MTRNQASGAPTPSIAFLCVIHSAESRFWDAYKQAAEEMFDAEKEFIIQSSTMAGGASLAEHTEEWKKVLLALVFSF